VYQLGPRFIGCLDPITLRPLEAEQQVRVCQCQTAYHEESWALLVELNNGRCVNCHAQAATTPVTLRAGDRQPGSAVETTSAR